MENQYYTLMEKQDFFEIIENKDKILCELCDFFGRSGGSAGEAVFLI